jgi:hypothetical protein
MLHHVAVIIISVRRRGLRRRAAAARHASGRQLRLQLGHLLLQLCHSLLLALPETALRPPVLLLQRQVAFHLCLLLGLPPAGAPGAGAPAAAPGAGLRGGGGSSGGGGCRGGGAAGRRGPALAPPCHTHWLLRCRRRHLLAVQRLVLHLASQQRGRLLVSGVGGRRGGGSGRRGAPRAQRQRRRGSAGGLEVDAKVAKVVCSMGLRA